MFWILVFGLIILILAILKSLITFKKYKLPGPSPWPIVGNILQLRIDPHEMYVEIIRLSKEYSKENGFFALWAGNHLITVITGTEQIEKILTSPTLITKASEYKLVKPWIGDGLLLSSGSKWHSRRKLLTPAFHFKVLDIFIHSFNKYSSKLVDILKSKTEKTFDIAPLLALMTLDMICETAMGIDIKALDNSDSEYVKAVKRISALVSQRSKYLWLQFDLIFNLLPIGREHNRCLDILHNFTKNVIKEKRQMRNESISSNVENNEKFALLDLLLKAEESNEINNEAIQEEVDTFMFEGHDTTSTTLNWLIYLIALHNDVQDKILTEITDVLGSSKIDVSSSHLPKLKYLESVIKETLRLYPTVPNFSREVTEPLSIEGYQLPIGTTLSMFTTMMHRDPRYYKEPDKFNPDRWMVGNEVEKKPFTFLPFSAGMRNCIGQKFAMMEIKVFMTWLLRSYKISTHVKEDEFLPCMSVVLRPKNGVLVCLEERN